MKANDRKKKADTDEIVPPWMECNPQYWPSKLEEYRGNPVAEYITPIPKTDEEVMQMLAHPPRFESGELDWTPNERLLLPRRLLDSFVPVEPDLDVYYWLYESLLNSYRSPGRNPMTPDGQYLLHYGTGLSPVSILPGSIGLLVGLSGMGKSALVYWILRSFGKSVIRHSKYGDKEFTETQFLYLYRDAPPQTSFRMFAQRYGDHADSLLGDQLYGEYFANPRQNLESIMSQLKKIIANHFVGLLIIDVAENLTLKGPDGLEGFLAEFESIRNEYGISIILIGTYKFENKLKAEPTASFWRKIVDGGYHDIVRPQSYTDPNFLTRAKSCWQYQWLREPIEFDDEVASTLYGCSCGITGLMINLMVAAQHEALMLKREKIYAKDLQKMYEKRFKPLHEILDALRLNRKGILNRFDDLYKKGMKQIADDAHLAGLRAAINSAYFSKSQNIGSDPSSSPSSKKAPKSADQASDRDSGDKRRAG